MTTNLSRIAALLLASAAAMSAGTLTTILPTVNEASPTVGGTISLPEFNSALGTLTDVTLNFGAGSVFADTAISDIETTGGTINITYDLGYQVSFSLVGELLLEAGNYAPLTCSGFSPETVICDNSGVVSYTQPPESFDLSSDLAAFLTGPVSVPYTPSVVEYSLGPTTPASPSNLNLSVTNESFSMPVSITYTYTPETAGVPEPASLIMAGGGMIALGWLGRKRRKRS
jgi:PEP-CTERM motif